MNKTIKSAFAGILAVAILGGATLGGMQLWADDSLKPSNWGAGGSPDTGEEDYSGLMVSLESDSDIMTLSVDSNGEVADSVTITATINDPSSKYRNVVFSLDWQKVHMDPVSEYVTMTIQGNSVTATCLYPFTVPIILTATLEGTDVSATYRFDYLMPLDMYKASSVWQVQKGISPMGLVNSSLAVDYDRETPNNLMYALSHDSSLYGEGTVVGAFHLDSFEIQIPENVREALVERESYLALARYLTVDPRLQGVSVSVPEKITVKAFNVMKNESGLQACDELITIMREREGLPPPKGLAEHLAEYRRKLMELHPAPADYYLQQAPEITKEIQKAAREILTPKQIVELAQNAPQSPQNPPKQGPRGADRVDEEKHKAPKTGKEQNK